MVFGGTLGWKLEDGSWRMEENRNNECRIRINEVRSKINNKSRVGNIEIASPAGSGFAMTEGRMNVE